MTGSYTLNNIIFSNPSTWVTIANENAMKTCYVPQLKVVVAGPANLKSSEMLSF